MLDPVGEATNAESLARQRMTRDILNEEKLAKFLNQQEQYSREGIASTKTVEDVTRNFGLVDQNTIRQDGVDYVPQEDTLNDPLRGEGGGGVTQVATFYLLYANGDTEEITSEVAFSGATNDRSLEFTVGTTYSNEMDGVGNWETSSETGLYDTAGSTQSKSRLLIKLGGNVLSQGGVFQEEIVGVEGKPVAIWNKVA